MRPAGGGGSGSCRAWGRTGAFRARCGAGAGEAGEVIPVTHDPELAWILPSRLRRGVRGLDHFQLRVSRRITGEISLQIDGRAVIRLAKTWSPGRRILVPLAPEALTATHVHIGFREGF